VTEDQNLTKDQEQTEQQAVNETETAEAERQASSPETPVTADGRTVASGAEPETAENIEAEASSEPTVDSLKEEAEQLRRQADEYQQRWLRAQADFDNYRKRTLREKEDLAKYAAQQLIEQLLPVVDNFERAVETSRTHKDFESLVKGLDMVYRQFIQVLEQEGLQPIASVGEPFNPEFHQAVMQVESEEYGEGIVVEELQKGYKLKDRVIRPSMVKVSM
jgi:molecular chaperone GrpE